MRQKNIKSRCEKRYYEKCKGVCRTYDKVQAAYAQVLQDNPDVKSFRCNVYLGKLDVGEFTSDFVAVKVNGEIMVRECVWRKNLPHPRTLKLLDASRNYWREQGVDDWGIVIEEKKKEKE